MVTINRNKLSRRSVWIGHGHLHLYFYFKIDLNVFNYVYFEVYFKINILILK